MKFLYFNTIKQFNNERLSILNLKAKIKWNGNAIRMVFIKGNRDYIYERIKEHTMFKI